MSDYPTSSSTEIDVINLNFTYVGRVSLSKGLGGVVYFRFFLSAFYVFVMGKNSTVVLQPKEFLRFLANPKLHHNATAARSRQ